MTVGQLMRLAFLVVKGVSGWWFYALTASEAMFRTITYINTLFYPMKMMMMMMMMMMIMSLCLSS